MSEPAREEPTKLRGLVGLAAAVLVIAGARAAASTRQPLVFALFLGILSLPFFAWLFGQEPQRVSGRRFAAQADMWELAA